ncbi:MAG: SMP-30/gluconolactonase/LRE family protein [Paracoccaceae bacterium]
MTVFDDRRCLLGEGPLWHDGRQELFWFDILNRRMLSNGSRGAHEWHFADMVSAAAILSDTELLIASERALFRFDLETGARSTLCALEADDPRTRSNDGRADPQGGFWIGTMGKRGGDDPRLGSIWRWYRGELRRLFRHVTISNAISFAPDGKSACFADTVTGKVMRVALDAAGWPASDPAVFLDLTAEGLNPDGAVMDAAGNLWLAEWGAGRVACHAPDGRFLRAVDFAAPHTSCPAFGGPDLTTLYCTTAQAEMSSGDLARYPLAGATFAAGNVAKGMAASRVLLD